MTEEQKKKMLDLIQGKIIVWQKRLNGSNAYIDSELYNDDLKRAEALQWSGYCQGAIRSYQDLAETILTI